MKWLLLIMLSGKFVNGPAVVVLDNKMQCEQARMLVEDFYHPDPIYYYSIKTSCFEISGDVDHHAK